MNLNIFIPLMLMTACTAKIAVSQRHVAVPHIEEGLHVSTQFRT